MENMQVGELMVGVEKFPKISAEATFYEAVLALESAEEEYKSGLAEQRILLVQDAAGKVWGKISPINLFAGLETGYRRVNIEELLKQYGDSYIAHSMSEDMHLWKNPFHDLCRKAGAVKIGSFVNAPKEGQVVKVGDPLSTCFHRFVMNRHDTLFVVNGEEIVGLLLFADVYRKVSEGMKKCFV